MNRFIRELDGAELTAVSGGASQVIETAQHIGGEVSFWSGLGPSQEGRCRVRHNSLRPGL